MTDYSLTSTVCLKKIVPLPESDVDRIFLSLHNVVSSTSRTEQLIFFIYSFFGISNLLTRGS